MSSNKHGPPKLETYATADEAADQAKPNGATKAGRWEYRDKFGEVFGYVYRFDTKEEKQCCGIIRRKDGWQLDDGKVSWPLYRLYETSHADRVFICEDAMCADALISVGLNATASATLVWKTDWSPLAGKDVTILPASDSQGRQDAYHLTNTLKEKYGPAHVEVVEFPGLPENGGIIDWIEQFGDAAEPDVIRSEFEKALKAELRKQQRVFTANELVESHPKEAAPLIDGLLRRGETANLIAAPKAGKSWLTLGLAISVAAGEEWLGFSVAKGKVLLVDNELNPATIAFRLKKVANAMAIDPDDLSENLNVKSLRGEIKDLYQLELSLNALQDEDYSLIVLDAFYRLLPADANENSNGDITQLYNALDRLARKLDCAIVCIHHASKGDQSQKGITDVGSGAGAQSRAADAHIVLRPHKLTDLAVVDAAVRSFPPVQQLSIQWKFPCWIAKPMITPEIMTKQEAQQSKNDEQGMEKIMEAIGDERVSCGTIRKKTGMGDERVKRLLNVLLEKKRITQSDPMDGEKGKSYYQKSC